MVATLIFSIKVSTVSSARITTSERLQNPLGRNIISPQGFVVQSCRLRLRFGIKSLIEYLLKIPRSPVPLSARANHSFMKSIEFGLTS